ncbi:MAG: (2Fe-2S)-binding protein [SAR324 cluster bacterium]|jgi:predicted molibdopterin-dependent oxidoreductase YjgC|nr:(2Fe-2S)-binding protein [SAR324 cluster bacterium]|tara:strand:- start:3171 stop:3467 length:297 start_codon:yes stop_codon:yes gene_type:complete
MLKRLCTSKGKAVTFRFEEKSISAQEGDTVAAALLVGGEVHLRTSPVSGGVRAPYCWMGVCFECLLEIDGQPNQQSCLIPVKEGMCVRRQSPAPEGSA